MTLFIIVRRLRRFSDFVVTERPEGRLMPCRAAPLLLVIRNPQSAIANSRYQKGIRKDLPDRMLSDRDGISGVRWMKDEIVRPAL